MLARGFGFDVTLKRVIFGCFSDSKGWWGRYKFKILIQNNIGLKIVQNMKIEKTFGQSRELLVITNKNVKKSSMRYERFFSKSFLFHHPPVGKIRDLFLNLPALMKIGEFLVIFRGALLGDHLEIYHDLYLFKKTTCFSAWNNFDIKLQPSFLISIYDTCVSVARHLHIAINNLNTVNRYLQFW